MMSKIVDFIKRKILRKDRDRWNHQYASGRWDVLAEVSELSRFSVIVGYTQHLKPNGKILELGAGEGILQQRFDKTKYSLYYSTDVSDVAIERGKKHEDEKTKFLVADMNNYIPDTTFDCIIINEAIYYSKSVENVLGRLSAFLNPDGIFILSLHGHERNEHWHKMVEECSYPKIDRTVINGTKNSFVITVLKGK